MKAPPGTPKLSGKPQRWGRPAGELSRVHAVCAVGLVLVALALFLIVLRIMKRV
jgi:hypothetical protein